MYTEAEVDRCYTAPLLRCPIVLSNHAIVQLALRLCPPTLGFRRRVQLHAPSRLQGPPAANMHNSHNHRGQLRNAPLRKQKASSNPPVDGNAPHAKQTRPRTPPRLLSGVCASADPALARPGGAAVCHRCSVRMGISERWFVVPCKVSKYLGRPFASSAPHDKPADTAWARLAMHMRCMGGGLLGSRV